ncbi:MAG: alkaline phosphatase D family protein, partial [Planctomycetaceae bacterium]|nr:alkaline phosphatase D family protein [Planctomycetaceae bacterium]
GPEGQRIQIILLDTRYFRSPLKAVHDRSPKAEGHSGPYGPTDDPDAVMLGEAQWTWLEQQLKVPAEIRLIVSSIQVLPVQHRWEKWENLPRERERLLNLITRTNANGVIFLSGDRHAAEFSKLKRDDSYTLWELTSSSLNSPRKLENEINDYRHGILYNDENFGMLEVDWLQDDPPITLSIRDLQGTPIMQVATRLSAIQP